MDACEMSLLQHASSLLLNLQRLHLDSLFSDLQIFCDDGVIQSYRLVVGGCSDMVRACLAPHTELEVDTLILPGITVSDLQCFHNCIYSSNSISQTELEAVLRVLVALGGDITQYIEVNKQPAEKQSDVKRRQASKLAVADDCAVEEPPRREVKARSERDKNSVREKSKQTAADSSKAVKTTTYTFAVNEKDEIVSKSGPKFACDKCYMEFDKETEMEKHLKADCTKQHFCETCNKVFSSSQTFNNHMKLHTKELEFKCYICGKCYVSRSVLGNHMKTHDENNKIPRFNCDHCEKKFNHPSNLKRHIRTAHFELSDKKIYACPECGKTFKDPSARKHHLKIHMEVRPHPCDGCDKSFATKSQLESHVRIHTGEKPFVCSLCGRCFVTKGQLKSHKLNRHVGVKHSKSHLCQDCGQSFVKEYDLKVHMRKHTGERPFQCMDCAKTFRSERNLVNHQRIHTGDKPYKCETCGKGFASCAGLRQHFKCHAACRLQATEGAYCKQDRKSNRYGRVRLDSIPELPLEAAGTAGLQNLESFSVSELKAPEEGVEETVVYFNTDSGLGIGIEGVTIQGALEEVTNIEGVTIQAIDQQAVMAAKLKKRALAEYQSQVQVEDKDKEVASPENKRLKLSLRSESPEPKPVESILPVLDTEVATTREVIENIISFNVSAVTNHSPEVIAAALKKMSELVSKEKDDSVKAKLVSLWGEILELAGSEEMPARLEELVSLSEKSNKVLVSWLATLKRLVNAHSLSKALRQKIFGVASAVLQSSAHPVVHTKVLDLLSCLVSTDIPTISAQALELCGSYSMSQDARVRTSAFHGLLTIHRRGVKLDVSMYSVFCRALTDDYEGVRCQALRLLSALANTEPEFQVELESSGGSSIQTNRLVDDVFSRTCQAINDVRETVRVLAASLIGDMKGVSQMFLEQTLDKKLMSNMRMKRNAHERMANLVSSGEWSSGKRWADDAPKEEIDAEQVNLVTFGSCGAFVHGLEDECLSVRVATVQSLKKLAVDNQELAILALDFLTDMFNDEIEQVRLEAIGALTAIAQHIKLHVHQLEIILGALDDFSTLLREKLHLMLQSCSLATKDGLNMVIDKLLLVNLKRYPQDRRSIYVTFKHLGANHPELTLPLVSSLLKIHPYFDKQEEDIEDPTYLCKLILVLNAAQHCPTLPMLLDSHTNRHHDYLRDTFPHLMPTTASAVAASASSSRAQTDQFLDSVLSRVASTAKLPPGRAIAVLNTSSSELVRLGGIDTSLADPSAFARMYIECQALVLRIVSDVSWTQASLQQGPVIKTNMSSLQSKVLQLQSMFNNIGQDNLLLLRMLKLKVMAVTLVFTVCRSDKSALGPTEQFIREFDNVVKEMKKEEISRDSFLQGVMTILAAAEVKPGYLARELQPLLLSNPVAGLAEVPLQIKMTRAVIHEPAGGAETALKFMAGLVLGIHMDCEVSNIHHPDLLRICISTGDQQHHLSIPRRGDLVAQTDGSFRLLTTALMSHHVWSEPSDVEISLVLDLGPERMVHLCKPVKVSVLPKPVRRGI